MLALTGHLLWNISVKYIIISGNTKFLGGSKFNISACNENKQNQFSVK